MGTDSAPFWTNLYHYEKEYIVRLIHTEKYKASKFYDVFKCIDAICA